MCDKILAMKDPIRQTRGVVRVLHSLSCSELGPDHLDAIRFLAYALDGQITKIERAFHEATKLTP